MNNQKQLLIEAVKELLEALHFDLEDANFKETPLRVADSFLYSTRGTTSGVKNEVVRLFQTKFPTIYQGIVVTKNIHVWSMCPHHLKDVEYFIDFGIIYEKEALGLSRVWRIINKLAAQPVLQEDLTKLIVDEFNKNLNPKGVIIQLKGSHMCMKARGIKQDCSVTTSAVSGVFETDLGARQEFLNLIQK